MANPQPVSPQPPLANALDRNKSPGIIKASTAAIIRTFMLLILAVSSGIWIDSIYNERELRIPVGKNSILALESQPGEAFISYIYNNTDRRLLTTSVNHPNVDTNFHAWFPIMFKFHNKSEYVEIDIPFWFIWISTSAITVLIWRKTRRMIAGRAFRVKLAIISTLIFVVATLGIGYCLPQISHTDFIYRSLSEIPGISQDVIRANGQIVKVEEPILFNTKTQMSFFVVTILDARNFGDLKYLSFGGNSETLQNYVNEVRYINSPSNTIFLQGPWQVGKGSKDGISSLIDGMLRIINSPVESAKELGSGAQKVAMYIKKWLYDGTAHPVDDTKELAGTFYLDTCCRVAKEHSVDFMDIKTPQAKAALQHEAAVRVVSRGAFEVVLLLVPFSEIKYGSEAAEVSRGMGLIRDADELAALGEVDENASRLLKYGKLFGSTAEVERTVSRLKFAEKFEEITKPVARLGRATTTDYKSIFFDANPALKGDVVVHHAIEQQALTRFPGIIDEVELNSLENLRGIPVEMNDDLHLSQIRREWNDFYASKPTTSVTKEDLLNKASEIDFKYGHFFNPKIK